MVYVNDLPEFIGGEKLIMFADDTTFTISAKNFEEFYACQKMCVKDWRYGASVIN